MTTSKILPYNLYVSVFEDREIWLDEDFKVRFTMPIIKELDEYPVKDADGQTNLDFRSADSALI